MSIRELLWHGSTPAGLKSGAGVLPALFGEKDVTFLHHLRHQEIWFGMLLARTVGVWALRSSRSKRSADRVAPFG